MMLILRGKIISTLSLFLYFLLSFLSNFFLVIGTFKYPSVEITCLFFASNPGISFLKSWSFSFFFFQCMLEILRPLIHEVSSWIPLVNVVLFCNRFLSASRFDNVCQSNADSFIFFQFDDDFII